MKTTLFLVSITSPPCPPIRYGTGHLLHILIDVSFYRQKQVLFICNKKFVMPVNVNHDEMFLNDE